MPFTKRFFKPGAHDAKELESSMRLLSSEGHSLEDPLDINPCRSKSSFIDVKTVVGLFV